MSLESQKVEEMVILNNTIEDMVTVLKSISYELSVMNEEIQVMISPTHFPEL